MRMASFLLLPILLTAGCVMGDLTQRVPLTRSLTPEEAGELAQHQNKLPGTLNEIEIAGRVHKSTGAGGFRERWWFPIYGSQTIAVVGADRIGAARHYELPSLFPGVSEWLGLRWGTGASFLREGDLDRRVWTAQVNPLLRFSQARAEKGALGWDIELLKGFFAIGVSPRSLAEGGVSIRFLWVLGRRHQFTTLETGY
jgi:hypothetical protein